MQKPNPGQVTSQFAAGFLREDPGAATGAPQAGLAFRTPEETGGSLGAGRQGGTAGSAFEEEPGPLAGPLEAQAKASRGGEEGVTGPSPPPLPGRHVARGCGRGPGSGRRGSGSGRGYKLRKALGDAA